MSARFDANRAKAVARTIQKLGRYRASVWPIAQGLAAVELRSTVRPHPIVATLRTDEDAAPYLEEASE